MGSVSDYMNNKKVNIEKTFRNIKDISEELRQLTVTQKLKGRKPLTRKQQELTEILMKYEDNEPSNENNLALSKECATAIAKKYDLFVYCLYLILLIVAFFFPFWNYFFSLSLPFLAINIILIGLLVFFLGIMARFSLKQKSLIKIYLFVIFTSLLITSIFR